MLTSKWSSLYPVLWNFFIILISPYHITDLFNYLLNISEREVALVSLLSRTVMRTGTLMHLMKWNE